jgi:hypothetical protein
MPDRRNNPLRRADVGHASNGWLRSFAGISIVFEKQWKAKAAMAISHGLGAIITKL